MFKRILIPLAILLVTVFLMSACGKTATTTTTSSAPQTTSTTAATTTTATSAPTTATTSTTVKPTTGTSTSTTTTATATTKAPKTGGILRFADPRGPSTTLGWFAEAGASGGMWSSPTFDTLMEVDKNNQFNPRLATEWKVSDDLKTVTLTLRKGVKFHDGSDFNASVAKWNIDNNINAKLGVNYSYMTSVTATDDYTLTITLSKYNNTILNTISGVYMVSKASFDSKGKDWLRWNPVGTGAFKFVSFERDVKITFAKNPNYWRAGQPYLDGIEMFWVPDPTTMVTGYLAGNYDAIGGDLLGSFLVDMKDSTFLRCYSGAYTLAPDSKNIDSPWNNLKVRQALDYAIDRTAIAKARGFGYWTPVYQFANPDTASYNKNLPDRAFNVSKAKQLLAEAGFPNGFQTKLYADTSSSDKDAATAIQAQMNAIGIKTELVMSDFASYGNFRTKGWNNSVLAGMAGFFANSNQITDFYWAKTATYYPSLDKTDALQTMHLASLGSKDFDPLAYQKVSQYLYDNALIMPLWASSRVEATRSFMKDTGFYELSTWAGWRPYQAWLDK